MNHLRTQINIEESSFSSPNEYNESKPIWTVFKTPWASIKPLSGRQLEFARSFSHTANYSILIRFHKGILPTMRINHGGRIFNINAVLDQDASGQYPDRHIWLTIFCTEAPSDNLIPPAPSSLSVTAVSEAEIDLHWTDNAKGAYSFIIERSLNGTIWTQLATTAAGATSYDDTGLTPATTYYYRVRTTSDEGDSANITGSDQTFLSYGGLTEEQYANMTEDDYNNMGL